MVYGGVSTLGNDRVDISYRVANLSICLGICQGAQFQKPDIRQVRMSGAISGHSVVYMYDCSVLPLHCVGSCLLFNDAMSQCQNEDDQCCSPPPIWRLWIGTKQSYQLWCGILYAVEVCSLMSAMLLCILGNSIDIVSIRVQKEDIC